MTAIETTKKSATVIDDSANLAGTVVSGILQQVLVEPWITEKSHALMQINKYVFKISPRATKKDVEAAVQKLFKVSVISVRIVKIPRKRRVIGRSAGWKSAVRKAIVTLKEGDKIELFQGV